MCTVCTNCSKSFKTKPFEGNFCTFRCKVAYEKITRNCKICEGSFVPNTSTRKYCSKECSDVAADQLVDTMYKVSRFAILKRDNFSCVYCGKCAIDGDTELHVDHVYPRDLGGGNDPFNLVTACIRCNLEKSKSPLSQEITLKIWERNERLHENDGLTDYEHLKSIFDGWYKVGQ
jgi:endogenous inhibitor of DNA gyrase (YacG/DUF329 family)